MKKFLLTTLVFLSIGSVVMAQQQEPKMQVQQKARTQKQANNFTRITALKKAYKSKNQPGLATQKTSFNREAIIDESKSPIRTN